MRQTTGNTRSGRATVVSASLIGTTIEWYDFFGFGVAAVYVFPKLFFPSSDPATGTLLSMATFLVGFFARPLGGLVFGHFGDKIGRKTLLVYSLLLMGVSTMAMGLLPTYAAVGLAAPLILIFLRLIQGFAVGGEWGGAVLIVSEHGSVAHRGFWASMPQIGVPIGNLLANAVFALLAVVQNEADFLAWGWRIPFLISGILVVIGLWVRLAIAESPVFTDARAKIDELGVRRRAPILVVLRRYHREVLVAMGARVAENLVYYVITVFTLVYVADTLHLSRSIALNAVLIGSAFHTFFIPASAALSDRVGRKPVYMFGAIGTGVWAFIYFVLLNTKSFLAITIAVTVALAMHAAMYGPQAAFFSEMFGTGVRYSGASIGYQLASVVAGSPAPLVATALLLHFESWWPIAVYVAIAATITAIALLFATETRHRDLAADLGQEVVVTAR